METLPKEEMNRLRTLAKSLPSRDRKALHEELQFAARLEKAGHKIIKVHFEYKDSQKAATFTDVDVLTLSPEGELNWFELKTSLGFFSYKKPNISLKRQFQLRRLQKISEGLVPDFGEIKKVFIATLQPMTPAAIDYLRNKFPGVMPFSAGVDDFGPLVKPD